MSLNQMSTVLGSRFEFMHGTSPGSFVGGSVPLGSGDIARPGGNSPDVPAGFCFCPAGVDTLLVGFLVCRFAAADRGLGAVGFVWRASGVSEGVVSVVVPTVRSLTVRRWVLFGLKGSPGWCLLSPFGCSSTPPKKGLTVSWGQTTGCWGQNVKCWVRMCSYQSYLLRLVQLGVLGCPSTDWPLGLA